jgi:hypothetical protein
MPEEAKALLERYLREPPDPARLFSSPHESISGHRYLSDWLAGQLLDGALFRSVGVCDRVAIMLWARAGLPIPNRQGP